MRDRRAKFGEMSTGWNVIFKMKRYSFVIEGYSSAGQDISIEDVHSFEEDVFDLLQFVKVQPACGQIRQLTSRIQNVLDQFYAERASKNLTMGLLQLLQGKVIKAMDSSGVEFDESLQYQSFKALGGSRSGDCHGRSSTAPVIDV